MESEKKQQHKKQTPRKTDWTRGHLRQRVREGEMEDGNQKIQTSGNETNIRDEIYNMITVTNAAV